VQKSNKNLNFALRVKGFVKRTKFRTETLFRSETNKKACALFKGEAHLFRRGGNNRQI
jgi:hypothetical protein